MTQSTSPEMSVVVVSLDSYERIRLTIAALRAQTAKHRPEVVVVAPSREVLNLDEADLQEFLSFQVVEVGPIRSTGGAIAAGFQRASQAPVVAYAEEHSYSFPAWAEALLLAHKKPWGAVGAAIVNANGHHHQLGQSLYRLWLVSGPSVRGCHLSLGLASWQLQA